MSEFLNNKNFVFYKKFLEESILVNFFIGCVVFEKIKSKFWNYTQIAQIAQRVQKELNYMSPIMNSFWDAKRILFTKIIIFVCQKEFIIGDI